MTRHLVFIIKSASYFLIVLSILVSETNTKSTIPSTSYFSHPYQTTQDEVKRTSHKIPAQNYPYNFFPNVTQQASSFQRFDRPTPFQQGVFNDSKKSSPNGFLQRIYSVFSSFFGGVKARVSRIYDSLLGRNYWNSIDRQAGVGTLQGVAYAVAGAVAGGVAAQPEILGDAINPTTSTTTTTTTTTAAVCDPNTVNLLDSQQWQDEVGYWVGEYSFYGSDGNAYTSSSWNYPYDHYKGFVTGNVKGNKYRQRNVFMYPAQTSTACASDSSTQGTGTCGTNGNMKVFEADQTAITCSLNPELKGDIEGPFGSLTYTYTQLVGNDNALLYQVWIPVGTFGITSARLLQSQLTTITKVTDSSTGATVIHRTRTAQGFNGFSNIGTTSYASYYREQQVSQTEFWTQFNAAKTAYNILDSDTCAWKNSDTGSTVSTGYTPGVAACMTHLEESFQL